MKKIGANAWGFFGKNWNKLGFFFGKKTTGFLCYAPEIEMTVRRLFRLSFVE